MSEPDEALAEARAAYDRLMDAFVRASTDEYFDCFHKDASFVFPGEPVLDSRAEYRATWSRWQDEGVRFENVIADDIRIRVIGTTAVVTHSIQTKVVAEGSSSVERERETIVFANVGDRWLAVHEHLSPQEA